MNINQNRSNMIVHRLGMNMQTLQQRLADIQKAIVRNKKQLLAANPKWDVRSDMRITSLNNLASIVARTRLGIEFLSELLDDDWWQVHLSESVPENTKTSLTVSFERIVKYNFGMDVFTGIETAFRAFLRVLDPGACRGATAFKSIYNCLLGSNQLAFPARDRETALELLDFVRSIRNLIHNSGVYFSKDGDDQMKTYRGFQCPFRHGKPAGFVTWELVLALADDIRSLLVKVIGHQKLVAIDEITDPFAAHN